jgi:hypothetical protein
MKVRKYTFAVIFSFCTCFIFAQAEYIVEFDRVNGGFTKIQPAVVQGITWVFPNMRAYKESNGSYIFQTSPAGPDHLYSVNVTTGSIISNPPFTNADGAEFEFDNAAGTLYGLFFDQTNYYLETIDLATGGHNNVSSVGIPNMGICQGFSTFDEINHQYLLASDNRLLSIDATTGLISSNAALSLLAGELLVCGSLSFDNSTGILYGLLWDQNITGKYFLVSINSTSGAITKIGSGTILLEQGGSSAIDKAHQQYVYLYASQLAGAYEIATLDIPTGNVVYNVVVAPFINIDNFYGLEYDNVRNKLCGIHWESVTCSLLPADITASQNAICSSDSVAVCIAGTHASYIWNTGETTGCIKAHQAGNYYVTVTDANGCTAESNHLAITVLQSPPVSISVNGDTLSVYGAVTQQWYLNGSAINGATSNIYLASQGGSYTVMVTDTNGCVATSSAVIISGIENVSEEDVVSVYPNPLLVGSCWLLVGENFIGSTAEITDANGRLVFKSEIRNQKSEISFTAAQGVYLVRISSAKSSVVRKLVRL